MKLIFDKDENNEVTVKIQQGTVVGDFTYTEMVKQLLENNEIEKPDFNKITEEEKESLERMLEKISEIFNEEEEEEETLENDDTDANFSEQNDAEE